MSSGSFPGDIVARPATTQEQTPAVVYDNPEQAKALGEGEGENPEDELLNVPGLAGHIMTSWVRNKRARARIEIRLLECLRARRAEYSPGELQRYTIGAVKPPYLPLAAQKMRAADAALLELLLPEGERAWGLDPSPIPKLPPELVAVINAQAMEQAQNRMQQAAQEGQGTMTQADFLALATKLREELGAERLDEERKVAKDRARRMEARIAERMEEGGYIKAMREFMNHFCTFPSAVLKGPFTIRTRKLRWGKDPANPDIVDQDTLHWEAVNPFDCYPAPQAASCQDGDFIERLRFTRGRLYEMIGCEGYNDAAIRRVLEMHQGGGLQSWLWSDMERRAIEGNTMAVWKPDYLVDALHYWGSVQGQTLMDFGLDEKDGVTDPIGYYECDAILIGNEVIRCEVNDDPLGRRPYRNASFDEVPGAFWGNSLYELMRDAASMGNACFRALNANMGLASGPIMGADLSKMAAGEDPKALKPLDVIQLDTSRSSNQDASKALIFFQAEDRSAQLLAVLEACKKEADDLTGIPRYLYGDGKLSGGASTATGLSMLLGTASKGLRRAVSTIDRKVVAETVFDAYVWEMLYGDDPLSKGDCVVSPRGAAAILVKEHLQQTRVQFLQMTANPVDMQIIGLTGRRAVLAEVARVLDMDVDDIVPTEDELTRKLSQSTQPPQPTPDEQLKAQTKVQTTQMDNASRERVAAAKIGGVMAKEHLLHPDKAAEENLAQQLMKPSVPKPAERAYTEAEGNPPLGFGP